MNQIPLVDKIIVKNVFLLLNKKHLNQPDWELMLWSLIPREIPLYNGLFSHSIVDCLVQNNCNDEAQKTLLILKLFLIKVSIFLPRISIKPKTDKYQVSLMPPNWYQPLTRINLDQLLFESVI